MALGIYDSYQTKAMHYLPEAEITSWNLIQREEHNLMHTLTAMNEDFGRIGLQGSPMFEEDFEEDGVLLTDLGNVKIAEWAFLFVPLDHVAILERFYQMLFIAIDSSIFDEDTLAELEDMIYGMAHDDSTTLIRHEELIDEIIDSYFENLDAYEEIPFDNEDMVYILSYTHYEDAKEWAYLRKRGLLKSLLDNHIKKVDGNDEYSCGDQEICPNVQYIEQEKRKLFTSDMPYIRRR